MRRLIKLILEFLIMVMMEFIYAIYKKDSLIWTEFLCGLEIPLNLVFNQKKKKKLRTIW